MKNENYIIDILKQCYTIKLDDNPSRIFYIYNEKYIRQKKINKLLGIKKTQIDDKYNKYILEQDLKNKEFCIDYDIIWKFYETNFKLGYSNITELINNRLQQYLKINGYITFSILIEP